MFSLVLVVFPFWSIAASYAGAKTVFGVSGGRARIWFLILPVLLYVVAVGALGVVFALLGTAAV